MRRIWILFKHEYTHRVRTRSFIVTTFLLPVFMAFVFGVPMLAGREAANHSQRVVLVCDNNEIAMLIREDIARLGKGHFQISVEHDLTPAARLRLTDALENRRIDGFIWLDRDAIRSRAAAYVRRSSGDLIGQQQLRAAVTLGLNRYDLAARGIAPEESVKLMRPVQLEPIAAGIAPNVKSNTMSGLMTVLVLVMVLFLTLLSYGVSVMRSILEEKSSRVMEVLLCSATADELMAGKILGIGAVGLTQTIVWCAAALVLTVPGISTAHVPPGDLAYFGLFYIFGYLLYSAMFAAVGAAFNSADEAQHWTFVIISPLILATGLLISIAASPNSAFAFVLSMIPFTAPVLMYLRIVVERPATWQIALCIVILAMSAFAALRTAARVHRVGILMYGKRPTIREVRRWLRYA